MITSSAPLALAKPVTAPLRTPVNTDESGQVARVPLDPQSAIPAAGVDGVGRRLLEYTPLNTPTQPIHVFAGLNHGTGPERVDIAMKELERTGAFDRKNLLVAVAHGSGKLNPLVPETWNQLTKGDSALVSVQYSKGSSVTNWKDADKGEEVYRDLVTRIRDRIQELHPEGGGPNVFMQGNSLGAAVGYRLLNNTPGGNPLDELGIKNAIFTGVPGNSSMDFSRFGPGGVASLRGLEELEALTPQQKETARVLTMSHVDDPVSLISLNGFVKKPENHDDSKRWLPVVSMLGNIGQSIKTLKTPDGESFRKANHDYREEFPEMMRDGFRLNDLTPAEWATMKENMKSVDRWARAQDWDVPAESLAGAAAIGATPAPAATAPAPTQAAPAAQASAA